MREADVRDVAARAILAAVVAVSTGDPEAIEKAIKTASTANLILDGNLERIALSLVRTGELPTLTEQRK